MSWSTQAPHPETTPSPPAWGEGVPIAGPEPLGLGSALARVVGFAALYFALALVGNVGLGVLPRDLAFWAQRSIDLIAALAASFVLIAGVEHARFGSLGFASGWAAVRESARGLALGAALIGLVTLLLVLGSGIGWRAQPGTPGALLASVLPALVYLAVAAAYEEVLFRGYPFQTLVRAWGAWPATLVLSALFAGLHARNPSVGALALGNIFLAGVLLSWAYLRTRSLWYATGVHLGWNWVMASVLDLPVSGLDFFDTPYYEAYETGADVWTGGAFGPEAGLAATLVLLAGIGWLARPRSARRSV